MKEINPHIDGESTFLLLGSNIRPKSNITNAIRFLKTKFKFDNISNVYQSPAILGVNKEPQNDYLNVAVEISPKMYYNDLCEQLLEIENDLGRIRFSDKFAPRTIDIDVVLINNLEFTDNVGRLIPNPEIIEHPHILMPLSEIANVFIERYFGQKSSDIISRMDLTAVTKLNNFSF